MSLLIVRILGALPAQPSSGETAPLHLPLHLTPPVSFPLQGNVDYTSQYERYIVQTLSILYYAAS